MGNIKLWDSVLLLGIPPSWLRNELDHLRLYSLVSILEYHQPRSAASPVHLLNALGEGREHQWLWVLFLEVLGEVELTCGKPELSTKEIRCIYFRNILYSPRLYT